MTTIFDETEVSTVCEECNQTLYTKSSLNKGLCETMSQMFRFVAQKGINVFHPEKELLKGGYITANQRGNVSHLGNHGLIAKVDGEPGNWLLTRKASLLMKGGEVSKHAIVDKATKHTVGYLGELTTYQSLMHSSEYWYQIDFEIQEGRIVPDLPATQTLF